MFYKVGCIVGGLEEKLLAKTKIGNVGYLIFLVVVAHEQVQQQLGLLTSEQYYVFLSLSFFFTFSTPKAIKQE